jgi:photosystem II stability/assembly factor-like uncharacterized protein
MKLLVLICLLTVTFVCKAQQIPSATEIASLPLWAQKMYGDHPNVLEVSSLYTEYYRANSFEKNYHTQYFKRWKRKYIAQLDDQGFPIVYSPEEQALIDQTYLHKQSVNKSSNWSVVGPITNYQENNTQGSGQTNVYAVDQCLAQPNFMFCGTEPGEVYKSTDGGQNWTHSSMTLDFGSGVTAVEISPSNPLIVFAGGNKGVFRSTDGGSSWTNVLPQTNFGVNEILINPGNELLVFAATDKGLYSSSDGGTTWTQVYTSACFDIKCKTNNSNEMYLMKDNPSLLICEFFKSSNAGVTWQIQSTGWYASTAAGRTDGGARIGLTPANPNRIYVYLIGEAKTNDLGFIGIYRSDNSGQSWVNPQGIDGGPYDANHVNLAIGTATWLYHQGFYNCAIAASPTNADELLIGGLNLYRSLDGGLTFSSVAGYVGGPLGMHVDNQDFRVIGNTTWISTDGGIYKSTDFFTSQYSFKMSGVHGSDYWGFGSGWNEDILVGGLYHNGNLAYHENYGNGNFLELGGGEASTGYVNPGINRKTYFSDIGGKFIPLQLADPITGTPFGMAPNESYYAAESSEFEFHPNCYSIGFLGKDNSIWKTTDAGASFNLLYTFGTNVNNGVRYIEVGSNNPDILYVNQQPASGNIGTLWKSIDGGISWNSCFIPAGNSRRMLLSLDPLNSNNLWIAYPDGSNGFKVFKTSDGGSTWTNLSSSILNNESIQSIVHIPGTDGGIYAATNKAVYYRNNTTNWVIDNAGLPTFTNGNILRPFFRDNKIRLASYGKGIWESQLNETPSFPIARINVDKLSQMGICDLDSFYFEDHSYLNHTNAQWNWTFPTGSPATSTQRNPTVLFNQAGSHLAVLQVTDANGNSDIDSLYVQVSFYTLPTLVQEDFEGNFIPNGWSIDNQDNGSTWTLSSTAGGFGNSSQSALFNNYDYDAQGTFDDLIVNFDASTIASNPYMTYDVAYARWGGGYPDSMAILASTDCGLTYQELYMDGGVTLATAPDIQSFFTPSATQWRKDSINLAAFNGSANLQIAFRSIGKWGNNLYIDNVNLDNQSGMLEPKDEYLSIFPNPIQGDGLLTIKTIPFSKIKIIDMNGKLVQEAKGEGTLTIPLNKLKAGTYMINVESATKIWNKPLIIR